MTMYFFIINPCTQKIIFIKLIFIFIIFSEQTNPGVTVLIVGPVTVFYVVVEQASGLSIPVIPGLFSHKTRYLQETYSSSKSKILNIINLMRRDTFFITLLYRSTINRREQKWFPNAVYIIPRSSTVTAKF